MVHQESKVVMKWELLAEMREGHREAATEQELLIQADFCGVGGSGARLGSKYEVHRVREAMQTRLMQEPWFPHCTRPRSKQFLKDCWGAGKQQKGRLRLKR